MQDLRALNFMKVLYLIYFVLCLQIGIQTIYQLTAIKHY